MQHSSFLSLYCHCVLIKWIWGSLLADFYICKCCLTVAKWAHTKTVFKYTEQISKCICESCKNNVRSPVEANINQSVESGTRSSKGLNVAQHCQSHECQYMCRCSVLTDRPPPIILQGPVNQTLAVDGTALLKCKATGDPLPVISWLKEGFTFLGRDPRTSIQDQGTLQIKTLRVSNNNKANATICG